MYENTTSKLSTPNKNIQCKRNGLIGISMDFSYDQEPISRA